MNELIVPSRLLIEDNLKYAYISRIGVTCFNDKGNLVSFVFDPKDCSYTVNVQENFDMGMHFMVSHTFVERFMKWLKIAAPYQVWRWHVDVYPIITAETPTQYSQQVDTVIRDNQIWRTSFEHITGPELVTPALLGMQFAADTIEVAACPHELVPERRDYMDIFDQLYHPGCTTINMGILGEFDLMNQKELHSEKPKWIM